MSADTDDLAGRLADLAPRIAAWQAAVPPWQAVDMTSIDKVATEVATAMDRAEAVLGRLRADMTDFTSQVVTPLDDLTARFDPVAQTLSGEAQRVFTLLDPLDDATALVTDLATKADAVEQEIGVALTMSGQQVEQAHKRLADQCDRSRAAFAAAWQNLDPAFDRLDTALRDAVAKAGDHVDHVLPAFGIAADGLGRDAAAQVAESMTRDVEGACRDAVGRVRTEAERAIDDAVAALVTAIGGFGDDAQSGRGGVEARSGKLLADVQAILPLGADVSAEALQLPMKVALILAKRLTGGLL